MALVLALKDLVKATLPQGYGRVGFIGVAPAGEAYHVLSPVEMIWARAVSVWGAEGRLDQGGARLTWRYHLCRPYLPPPLDCNRPVDCDDFRLARRAQAVLNGDMLVAWGRRLGWWIEVERTPGT